MTQEQRLHLLTNFCVALGNENVLKREQVELALSNYFEKLERHLPIILLLAKPNDPPPPNWRAFWRGYSK